jgi:hypothetical protein
VAWLLPEHEEDKFAVLPQLSFDYFLIIRRKEYIADATFPLSSFSNVSTDRRLLEYNVINNTQNAVRSADCSTHVSQSSYLHTVETDFTIE